jgi:hypothetical protein
MVWLQSPGGRNMRIKMNYGRDGLFIDFPAAWDIAVIENAAMSVLADPAGAVLKALFRESLLKSPGLPSTNGRPKCSLSPWRSATSTFFRISCQKRTSP